MMSLQMILAHAKNQTQQTMGVLRRSTIHEIKKIAGLFPRVLAPFMPIPCNVDITSFAAIDELARHANRVYSKAGVAHRLPAYWVSMTVPGTSQVLHPFLRENKVHAPVIQTVYWRWWCAQIGGVMGVVASAMLSSTAVNYLLYGLPFTTPWVAWTILLAVLFWVNPFFPKGLLGDLVVLGNQEMGIWNPVDVMNKQVSAVCPSDYHPVRMVGRGFYLMMIQTVFLLFLTIPLIALGLLCLASRSPLLFSVGLWGFTAMLLFSILVVTSTMAFAVTRAATPVLGYIQHNLYAIGSALVQAVTWKKREPVGEQQAPHAPGSDRPVRPTPLYTDKCGGSALPPTDVEACVAGAPRQPHTRLRRCIAA